jgi:uncharacterized protein HemX
MARRLDKGRWVMAFLLGLILALLLAPRSMGRQQQQQHRKSQRATAAAHVSAAASHHQHKKQHQQQQQQQQQQQKGRPRSDGMMRKLAKFTKRPTPSPTPCTYVH